jgi:broad specificity phosphatase PhoE
MTERTVVHLLRHGEVFNPEKILYGRLPGYHLSELGRKMADRAAAYFADRDVAVVTASPLERAQETATPIAAELDLSIGSDDRLIEAGNVFEGRPFGVGDGALRHPRAWLHLRNPFRPSWGEPYVEIARRMHDAMATARDAARGREAVLVSHQLPIWVARLNAERRSYLHDPRRRECSLASVTSFEFSGDTLVTVSYAEPSRDLLPGAQKVAGA